MAYFLMQSISPIVAVCGTRPEFIKIAPVLRELNRRGIRNHLILTGQHLELVEGLCDFFEIGSISILDCARKGTSLNDLLSVLLAELQTEVVRLQPSYILVQGDTTSAFAGALTGFHLRLPIGHIEAGLRTGDIASPFPEEANRRLISEIATMHFTPTAGATTNLLNEGISTDQIFEVGNTIVDATEFAVHQSDKYIDQESDNRYTVITVHRRESWDRGIGSIMKAVKYLAQRDDSHTFKFVMHANPELQSQINEELGGYANIELLPPIQYPEFVALISRASMILSDSGGIQEEAPSLKVPTVVLRNITERPEAMRVDACRLGGTETESIIQVVEIWQQEIKDGAWTPALENPFGDGHTSARIVDHIENYLAGAAHDRNKV